jgi:DNA adenine methylase
VKPPFPYFGGKQRIARRIIEAFPPHLQYVEPYCGGLAVLMAKDPIELEVVNDLDEDLMTFWRVLRDRGDDLERVCALTPHSRSESLLARDRDSVDDLERARRVWVALTQRRSGQLRATGFRYIVNPKNTSLSLTGYLDGYMKRFAPAIERLRNVTLECLPAVEVIQKYGAHQEALLYVDPPYLGTTRGATSAYQHEMKGEAEHRVMAEVLSETSASVVVSGYDSGLYRDVFEGWERREIRAFTGQANARVDDNSRVEVLWIKESAWASARRNAGEVQAA